MLGAPWRSEGVGGEGRGRGVNRVYRGKEEGGVGSRKGGGGREKVPC